MSIIIKKKHMDKNAMNMRQESKNNSKKANVYQ